jgi:hypothetical protein
LEQVFLKIGHLTDPEQILEMTVSEPCELNETPFEISEETARTSEHILSTDPESLSSSRSSLSSDSSRKSIQSFIPVDFSLDTSQTDERFFTNLKAVLYKRTNTFKRNRRSFLFETVIPALLVLIGVLMSKYSDKHERSPAQVLEPSMLPQPQHIMINRTPID